MLVLFFGIALPSVEISRQRRGVDAGINDTRNREKTRARTFGEENADRSIVRAVRIDERDGRGRGEGVDGVGEEVAKSEGGKRDVEEGGRRVHEERVNVETKRRVAKEESEGGEGASARVLGEHG